MIPKLVRLSRNAPKDRHKAWDTYWAGIRATGPGGEVLWDSGSDHEFHGYTDSLLRHLDPALPVVDTGCGHGSFTRALAAVFPNVIGVDVSRHAVARARAESAGNSNTSFEARDMTADGAGSALADSIGAGVDGANVFIRGVLHVLDPDHQTALVENLRHLAGRRGTVFMAETNFQGNPVEYVSHLGATTRGIPAPLELAIRGLPMPGHFGPEERERAFPASAWELLEDGHVAIETNPATGVPGQDRVPGYYAVVRPLR
ncbi:class I SAM-dependent methyltransferase [Pseudarthrobacter defluvii]|uniref:class I SAM-dependent methyltransferase n=1 Tax=Pseudarthrobacter defluvii TaxID=410837 RepID=UPI0027D8B27C|nr:class I SAM-dependent methyltransferase [Pseudarthrobacter defluvii]